MKTITLIAVLFDVIRAEHVVSERPANASEKAAKAKALLGKIAETFVGDVVDEVAFDKMPMTIALEGQAMLKYASECGRPVFMCKKFSISRTPFTDERGVVVRLGATVFAPARAAKDVEATNHTAEEEMLSMFLAPVSDSFHNEYLAIVVDPV